MAVYGFWVKITTPRWVGLWHYKGECISPGYDWLSGCLTGLEFQNGKIISFFVAEKSMNRLLLYRGEYQPDPDKRGDFRIKPQDGEGMTWTLRPEGGGLLIRFTPKGPWVVYRRGTPATEMVDFKRPPNRAGVEPAIPQIDQELIEQANRQKKRWLEEEHPEEAP